ncbi:MAG TPA: putative porin [Acidobacteriota bacterium]
MRTIATLLIVVGLTVGAQALSLGGGERDKNAPNSLATKDPVRTTANAKTETPRAASVLPGAALEARLQELNEIVQAQSRELEAQRRKIEVLESQVNAASRDVAGTTDTVRPSAGEAAPSPASPVTHAEVQEYTAKVDSLSKKVDGALNNLGGFKFSGDFRFRLDAQLRSSNEIAGPLQNIRSRYRLRVNVDKEMDPRIRFHMQLSTGPLNNGITNDQDFCCTVTKHPFSIAEAYIDFHAGSNLALRGGRMEEVFADGSRFLWDDDVRFNGFHQTVKIPFKSAPLGIRTLELRAGEYILSNPNVIILAPSSPFITAGFQPGQKVRSSALFHPGFVIRGDLGNKWGHQITADVQLYRNPNEIQLASLANGFPVLISNGLGIALSGPMTGSGNATTTPGGAVFTARDFHIVHLAYRLESKGVKVGDREMPLWLDFQVSRNTGTGKLRDAVMSTVNFGSVKKWGDMRFLYQFAIKDANSMISQFTDDDLGTGTGVNIAVHAVRFDLGLTRFLQWQNLLFIQHERRPNNPAELFFVPLQQGANGTFRYLGQLAFTF